ncbi:MAG: alpha/beta hydrolase [Alphaproteobacteria bacterium]|nr:alpha/beta hydrolase [Alphaproteobacteria bacterium]
MNTSPDPAYEAEYNLRGRHKDADVFIGRWTSESERVRKVLKCKLDERVGPAPKATLDVFPASRPGSPIFVFIHGGYWRRMDKLDHSFVAEVPIAAGAAVAVINYDLCPGVTIDQIVAQCRDATAWVYRHAADMNGDANRIFVSGHSAGGHLTATTIWHDWRADGLPADLVKGALPISGIFDLHPIRRTSINDDVRLDQAAADRLSPLFHRPRHMPPVIAAVGEGETYAFREQNRLYAETWRLWGGEAEELVLKGVHHFDVILEFAHADSALCKALFELMGLGR